RKMMERSPVKAFTPPFPMTPWMRKGGLVLSLLWHPGVLEQAQRLGMSALRQTVELASPRPKYTAVKQGVKEPFLEFVERIAASLEKQVEDDDLRQILCTQLAKENANEDCQKVIEAMPGKPTVPEMVAACSKVGSVEHNMTALAAALRPSPTCFRCGQEGHVKASCPSQGKRKGKPAGSALLGGTCNRCGRPGHFAKQCRSKFHANGRPLTGNGKMSAGGRGRMQIPHSATPRPCHPFGSNFQVVIVTITRMTFCLQPGKRSS
uniref:CCHC-type domain-containing protein n=1 Tax=Nothoprocta perdicaria TaxID=30464 RepID=A0A8C7EAS0_NOTPE